MAGEHQDLLINREKIRPLKNASNHDRRFTCHLLLRPTLGTRRKASDRDPFTTVCMHANASTHRKGSKQHIHTFLSHF